MGLFFYCSKTLSDCHFEGYFEREADSPKLLESLESKSKGRNRWTKGSCLQSSESKRNTLKSSKLRKNRATRFSPFCSLCLRNLRGFVATFTTFLLRCESASGPPWSSCFQLLRPCDHLTRPLCSSPITSLPRSYEWVRPSAPHRYARLAVFAAWASPFGWHRRCEVKNKTLLQKPRQFPTASHQSGVNESVRLLALRLSWRMSIPMKPISTPI
jgi:hypothetical protein